MRFSMLSVLRARNECELTFPTLTRRARHSAIDSVNKSRPANSFSNRTPKRFLFLPRYTIYEVIGKSRIKISRSELDVRGCELFYFVMPYIIEISYPSGYLEGANYKYTRISAADVQRGWLFHHPVYRELHDSNEIAGRFDSLAEWISIVSSATRCNDNCVFLREAEEFPPSERMTGMNESEPHLGAGDKVTRLPRIKWIGR